MDIKTAVQLAVLAIINSVYGNRGNQAVVSFSKIQKYIENRGIRLKKPVKDAFSDPILSGFIRSSRVKYHVHLVLRMLASNGFLEHDKRHCRFIITSVSPLWEPAKTGDVGELYGIIMRIVGGFSSNHLTPRAREGAGHASN